MEPCDETLVTMRRAPFVPPDPEIRLLLGAEDALNCISLTRELSKALEVLAEMGHFVKLIAEDLHSILSQGR